MSILRIGPDGMVIVYALIMSVIVAVLSWRRVTLARAITVIMAAAIALTILQYFTLDPADLFRQLVRASFIVVPSSLLLAASRVNWLAQRAWLFILVGPIAFVGCYVGICEICYSANLV